MLNYSKILKGGVGSGRYKVTVTDHTNNTEHDYTVHKATSVSHAKNIAMILHQKKYPTSKSYSTNSQKVQELA